ncbi:endonuclease VII domain-containing protein [Aquamicrobium terrae]
MAEYQKTYKRPKLSPEERAERNRLRRERYANDPEHREKLREQARRSRKPAQKRAAHLKREFALTPEAFEALLERQGGGCAICHAKVTGLKERGRRERSLHVDHCHETGRVRGILCHRCNFGLGHFRDDPELLERAAAYLVNSSSGAT